MGLDLERIVLPRTRIERVQSRELEVAGIQPHEFFDANTDTNSKREYESNAESHLR
jgi:hypothetical protein